jgi:hypothetical protein
VTSIQAHELHNHARHPAGDSPGEVIVIGLHQVALVLVQALVLAHALAWSMRSRPPVLPFRRPRRRPCRRPGHQRWQAIFPALPRPGPGVGPVPPATTATRRVSA